MARRPDPLPPALGQVFTVAEARRRDVRADRLVAGDLDRPWHGVRSRSPLQGLQERLRALALVLPPEAAFSHVTAAILWRLPLPILLSISTQVHVTTPPGSPRVVRAGVVGHRGRPVVRSRYGLRVSDPVSTWVDLAGCLDLDDLVAMGDAIVLRGLCSIPELREAVEGCAGARGVRRMRQACDLIRFGSESVMETKARLVMHRARLPEPVLNQDIYDDNGDWLGRPDFAWPEHKVLVEYDGDHHRTDRAQWRRDVARRRLMQEAGWRVIVITADDVLRHPGSLVELLRAVLV